MSDPITGSCWLTVGQPWPTKEAAADARAVELKAFKRDMHSYAEEMGKTIIRTVESPWRFNERHQRWELDIVGHTA